MQIEKHGVTNVILFRYPTIKLSSLLSVTVDNSVAEQKDMEGHDNQQVVYRSKKPTDSSSNSMKGVKISILSGPLNRMALGLLFLNECDNRQQGQERTASNMEWTRQNTATMGTQLWSK